MSLTLKETFRRPKTNQNCLTRIRTNILESWFNDKEKEFLTTHDILIDSVELYDRDDCDSYEEYNERQDNGDYTWKFKIYIDGEFKFQDYANSSDYITSYIEEQIM